MPQPVPKTLFVLTGNIEPGEQALTGRASLRLQNRLWSNHESYFDSSLLAGGNIDSFFDGGADPRFRFLRLKRGSPVYDYCNSIATNINGKTTKKHIGLTSEDKFEMVGFTMEGGSWKMQKKDIGWEEAFAFMLTNNRFRGEGWEIHKIAEGAPRPENCQDLGSLAEIVSTLKINIIPLITDKDIAQNAAKALDTAFKGSVPRNGAIGIPVGTVDDESSRAIRGAMQMWMQNNNGKTAKIEDERYKLYKQILGLTEETRNYILHYECESIRFQSECLHSKLEKLPLISDFSHISFDEMHRIINGLKRLLDRPVSLEGDKLKIGLLQTENELKKISVFVFTLSIADWLLNKQPSGLITLAQCGFLRSCQSLEGPGQNMWLEGAEIIDLMQIIYSNLFTNPAEWKDIRATVESAIKEAGNMHGTPLSTIDTETSMRIKSAMRASFTMLTGKKLVLHQRLAQALHAIESVPLPLDWINQGLPPLAKNLPGAGEIKAEEMIMTADLLVSHARARIPPFEKNGKMLKYLETDVIPLQTEIKKWAASYGRLQRALEYLNNQPGEGIKLMAAGAAFGLGGYLPETGDVLVSLPTEAVENGASLSMAKIAEVDDSENGLVQRDWEKVMLLWKVTGLLDIEYPDLFGVEEAAKADFGQKQVPIKIFSGSLPEIDVPRLKQYFQDEISKITSSGQFDEEYLEKLASYGISSIIVMPSSFILDCHKADASAIAKKGASLFKQDPATAIELFKAAAVKFSYTPSGLYVPKQKFIILNTDRLYEQNAFLHEIAHADEEARKLTGMLKPELLKEINRLQNLYVKNNKESRFSNHVEVANNSPNSAEERRADGLAAYWTGKGRLSRAASDLYNYFLASTMKLETKEVKIKDEKGTRKEVGLRLVKPDSAFSGSTGGLVRWISYNPFSSTYYIECLVRAGNQGRWVSATGCRFLPEVKK